MPKSGSRIRVGTALSTWGFPTGDEFLAPISVDYLIVAGGGAGGVLSYTGTDGANSVFSTVTSLGGGIGSGYFTQGNIGGSGGGGAAGGVPNNIGRAGTPGQGHAGGSGGGNDPGYPCGGGGGAGGVGGDATAYAYPNHIYNIAGGGGAGAAVSITGTSVTYAGGGGASRPSNNSGGAGGSGGGGAGWINSPNTAAVAGTTNTGGGGGAGGYTSGGGGGGGGLRSTVTRSGGTPGTVETALNLTTNTLYEVTVGAGGTASVGGAPVSANGGSGIVVLRHLTSEGTITIGAGLTGSTTIDGGNAITIITAGTGNVSWVG